MKFKKIAQGFAVCLVAGTAVTLTSPDVFANLNGRWISHPAAALRSESKQGQVDRIIEGNRFVYFSVRGAWFDRNSNNLQTTNFKLDPLQLFVYEKGKPQTSENIVPLAHYYDLSGSMPVAMNYSADKGVMAVAYENKCVDFLFEDGTTLKSAALKDYTVPGNVVSLNSISFDPDSDRAYVGASFGYAVFSLKDGSLENVVRLDKAVAWINRVGDHMVVFAGNVTPQAYSTSTYIYPVDANPSVDSPIADGANLQVLMPVSDSSFAALAPNGADTSNILKLYKIGDDGTVTSEVLESALTVDDAAQSRYRHMFRTDGFTQEVHNGYAISSNTGILFLKKDASGRPAIEKIEKPSTLTANERASKCASLNGTKVWLYTYETPGNAETSPRGFYTYEINGNVWSGKSEISAPNAPLNIFASFGDWNPKYGLLLRGPGTQFLYEFQYNADLDRLCSYDGNVWTDRSFAARNAKYIGATRFGNFVKSDPADPDMVWGSSGLVGLHRVSLADDNAFFGLGSVKNKSYETTYPGYHAPLDRNPAWDILHPFTNVDFDGNGNLWVARYMATADTDTDLESVQNSYTPIYGFTPEERENLDTYMPDVKAREIVVHGKQLSQVPKLIALKSEANKNYVMCTPKNYAHRDVSWFIVDHKGTVSDPSDDVVVINKELFDEDGVKFSYGQEFGFYEDMATGELWFFTNSGPIIVNPADYFKEGQMKGRKLSLKSNPGINGGCVPLESVNINYMTDDFLGRKWFATEQGLYCLSADASEILGYYTEENSGLPSNDVYNVVSSPSGAIFVMTARGLAEFRPEGSETKVEAGTTLNIWPSVVSPDYYGFVTVSGAEEGSEYELCDATGNSISLGKAENGKVQWHPEGTAPGRYVVKRVGVEEGTPLIILDR